MGPKFVTNSQIFFRRWIGNGFFFGIRFPCTWTTLTSKKGKQFHVRCMLSNFSTQTYVVTCIADRQLSGVAPATLDRHYVKMHLQRKNAGLYTRARINRRLHRTSCKVFKRNVWSHRGGRSVSQICWQRFTQI